MYFILFEVVLRFKSAPQKLNFVMANRARSLVVSDLCTETKGSQFESGCYVCAEVSSLQ